MVPVISLRVMSLRLLLHTAPWAWLPLDCAGPDGLPLLPALPVTPAVPSNFGNF